MDHIRSPIVDGEYSPFYKVYKKGGKVLLFGTHKNSLAHLADVLIPDQIPYQIFFPEHFPFRYYDPYSQEEKIYQAQLHIPCIYGATKKYFPYIHSRCDCYREKTFGNSYVAAVDAKKFVDTIIAEIRENGLCMYSPEFM